jgi:hypothetical protein
MGGAPDPIRRGSGICLASISEPQREKHGLPFSPSKIALRRTPASGLGSDGFAGASARDTGAFNKAAPAMLAPDPAPITISLAGSA